MNGFSPLSSMDAFLEATASRWAKMPEKIALKEGDQALKFFELEARANCMARKLVANGVGIGEFVGYLGPTGIPFVVTCWACLKAGMTFMPISPKFPDKSVVDILTTANAKAFVSDRILSIVDAKFCQIGLPDEEEDTQPYHAANVPATVLAAASTTSGSTGIPKISGETREIKATVALQYLEMTDLGDRSIFGHCGTLSIPWLLAALHAGACVTCYDAAAGSAQALFDWLKTDKVTHWHNYPALYRTLCDVDGALPDLETLVLCGEPIFRHDFELFERLTRPGATLFNIYAQQEYSLGAAFEIRNGERLAFDKIPVGRVIGENDLQILDEDGKPVGPRGIGEITHRSLRVPEGYVGNPERSAQAFGAGADGVRSFATGDLGYFDKEGLLHFVGRKDDRVKIRNFNVYPADIEQEIKPHPEVDAVAVTVKYCARNLPRLACFYEGAVAPADLKAWLSDRISAFMMPQFFVPVKALPRTMTGKLQRNRLDLPQNVSDAERIPARTPTEQALTEVWQDILGHEDFGVADNFFDVGGDSLRAMELLLLMNKRFGRLLTLDQVIMAEASIQGVAELIEANAEGSQLRLLKPGDSKTHIVVGHVYGGGVTDYLDFARA
ncbi:MAG: non-ribosomal peptide synthetase, partial [Rhodobacteraceae bacterium]|nr:non-ribosomal peptide synthetase [Paracoccaceae bacterium]